MHALFDNASAQYSICVQNDHRMCRDFTIGELQALISSLQSHTFVDLSGGAGHNDKYSERANIVNTEVFKNLPIKAYGGPGPLEFNCLWSEAGTSYSCWSEGLLINHNWPRLFDNLGVRTVRSPAPGIEIERYYL